MGVRVFAFVCTQCTSIVSPMAVTCLHEHTSRLYHLTNEQIPEHVVDIVFSDYVSGSAGLPRD